jgi:hypothetical protein
MIIPQLPEFLLKLAQSAILSRGTISVIILPMRRPLGCYLFALLFMVNGALLTNESHGAETAVWRLKDPTAIGGFPTTILGHPQVVADSDSEAIHFNGTSDGLLVPVDPLAGMSEFTIEALICPETDGLAEQRFFHLEDDLGNRVMMEIRLTKEGWALDTFLLNAKSGSKCTLLDRSKLHPAETWTWVALVYAKGHMTSYVNGVKELAGEVDFPVPTTGKLSLGVRQNKMYWFKGSLGGIRFHPTALAEDKLQRIGFK